MGSEQHYSLRWNDYTVKIVTAFQSLRDEEDFVDVTVACDGHSYSAHKMVLSACSPYFRSLLRVSVCVWVCGCVCVWVWVFINLMVMDSCLCVGVCLSYGDG
ncbi:Broad-complex core protein isoforms 1/2/3/4/5 [Portunus trituberculatus]|uniref:Broad-complex core protein isoforms 1/2/3/4/5 n=1 Tax=Portunus trituberculatus TaxID=210409 RepID=A0A5B7GQW7_PORTR|nr:Broad-complex core protein isoforms 1/2/3/4/5 [Portunus trituberculatus]